MNAELLDLMSAPYLEGGRSLSEGMDCLGIVLEGLRRQGLDSAAGALILQVSSGVAGAWHEVAGSEVRPNDIALSQRDESDFHISLIVEGDPLRAFSSAEGHGPYSIPVGAIVGLVGFYRYEES